MFADLSTRTRPGLGVQKRTSLSSLLLHSCTSHVLSIIGFQQEAATSNLCGKPSKSADQFLYFGRNISSTESDVNVRPAKVLSAIDRLSIIWKSNLFDRVNLEFFHAVTVSIQLYGCTTWMLRKPIQKRILRDVLNKSRMQHSTIQQVYGPLPPLSQTFQVKRCQEYIYIYIYIYN